jgi:superfamily II DNA or RNA helicase
VELFGEGYDLESQAGREVAIEAVGLARPTQSLTLHLQQVGRGLRVAPGKQHAVILDHAGNLLRHGLPDEDREWSLDGISKKRDGSSAPPVRQCMECFGVHAAALSACPYCGRVYAVEGREVQEVAGELQELDLIRMQMARKAEVKRARSREALMAVAMARGYKLAWVDHVMRARAQYARG